ncbi:MAG: hypothetical protein KDA73_18910 [Rhodobacteraceae bacterium]|nr:hypothetical protein [Paracoccaceae bacterium]
MKHVALVSAIVLGLAAPAFANDQIAQSLGVQPGQYSQIELARLKAAKDFGDQEKFADLMKLFSGDSVSTQSAGTSQGHNQIAATLRVEPGAYSDEELADKWVTFNGAR